MTRSKSTALVPYDPNAGSLLRSSFGRALEVYEYKNSIEAKRICAGDSPFAVWREERGLGKEAVADFLDLDIVDYIEIENDPFSATQEDVLGFCEMLRIHPYDLVGDDALIPAIRDALLAIHDDPYLVLPSRKRPDDLAFQLLTDEAETAHRLLVAQENILSSSYPDHHGLTLNFLRTLLRTDGDFPLGPLDIFDYAGEVHKIAEDEQRGYDIRSQRYTSDWKKHGKGYHLFGRYLFRDDWPEISKKLCALKDATSIDNVISVYLTRPDFIGRNSFPEATATIFLEEKAYSWRGAQQRHADYVETLFMAYDLKEEMNDKAESLDYQCNLFQEWVVANGDILSRYENRQHILRHSDFAHLVCKDPKLSVPNGRMGLYSLFIKPYLK